MIISINLTENKHIIVDATNDDGSERRVAHFGDTITILDHDIQVAVYLTTPD